MNTCDFLFDAAAHWRDHEAVVDAESGRRYTYGQLQAAVRAVARQLGALGLRRGDVVATHLYNGADAVLAALGAQYAGCTICLLDPLIPSNGLVFYLQDTRAACLVSHLSQADLCGRVPETIRLLGPADIAEASTTWVDAASRPARLEPDAVASIFYTSGTTSRPKGVTLSPANIRAHVELFTRGCYRYESTDRLLCFVPFSHGYGSISICLPCWQAGAAMVLLRSFHPLKVAEVVLREGVTHIFGVPSHFQQLLRRDELMRPMRGAKAAFSAAAPLKMETARAWREQAGYDLDEGYGLIETCTGVAFRRGRLPSVPGDVGSYAPDLVQIEAMNDALALLPPGERGEIVVRGPSVMRGYLNRPDETREVLADGWFRTGDLGYRTTTHQLVVSGRAKDVINVAGIKVAPFEVEAVLNAHPDVVESAVVGMTDETYGEVVRAFVRTRPGTTLVERDLIRFAQQRLMPFQVPKAVLVVEELPRNMMGKVDRNVLRAR